MRARLCAESSDRIPKFILPVIRHQLATGGEFDRAALVVAAWARYAEEPTAFLTDTGLFGDLAAEPAFVEVFTRHRRSLRRIGARATVERLRLRDP